MAGRPVSDSNPVAFNLPIFKLTLLHSEKPKLYTILAFLSVIGLKKRYPFTAGLTGSSS